MKKKNDILKVFLVCLLASGMVFTMMQAIAVPAFAEADIIVPPEERVNGAKPIDNTYIMNGREMEKDPDSSEAEASSGLSIRSTFPDKYRSDEQPWAKGIRIKDQLYTGLCWAFALTNTAEYSYAKEVYETTGKTGVVREMSPSQIGQFTYNRVNDPLGNTSGDYNNLGATNWAIAGGDMLSAMQHLATWSGAALEEKYPIGDVNKHVSFDKNGNSFWDGTQNVIPASGAYDDELTLQESVVLWYPEKNAIKELVLKYGAASCAMEFNYAKYMNCEEIDPETGDPYEAGRSFYNYTGKCAPNHELTIIGWDDTYPKENFSHVIRSEVDEAREAAEETAEEEARARAEADAAELYKDEPLIRRNRLIREYVAEHLSEYMEQIIAEAVTEAENETREKTTPHNDGAWIIQNSWGDYVHENGICYVSYEDADFDQFFYNPINSYDMQPVDAYKYNFQYDGTVANMSSSDISREDGSHLPFYTKPGTRAANVYTNDTGEAVNLEAVGYTTNITGTQSFEVSVYTGLTDASDPTGGKCMGTTVVKTNTRGVKTAALEKPVYIAPGETYSIVFDFLDYSGFGYEASGVGEYLTYEAQIDPGQSFFCRSKKDDWVDMENYGACFRIKGFANPTELIPDVQPAPSPAQPAASTAAAAETVSASLPTLKAAKVSSGKKKVTIKWKKLKEKKRKKLSGIEIQCSTDKSFSNNVKTVRAKANASSKKIKGLKAKKKYFFRLRTYRKTGGETIYGKWSKIKRVRTK